MAELMRLVELLNANSGAVQGVAVTILVLVTLWYALSNHRMVAEMREQSRPCVVIDFELSPGQFTLVVANTGNRPASNIRFQILKDLAYTDAKGIGKRLSEVPVIQKGIPFLSPGRRLLFWFEATHRLLDSKSQQELGFEVTISYEYGKRYSDTFDFDLSVYREGMLFSSFEDGMHSIKSSVDELTRSVRQLPRGFKDSQWSYSLIHASNVKRCPVCREQIGKDAKKCPKCQEWINDELGDESGANSENAGAGPS